MDLQLARTFLKVVDSGSFVNAASELHVTQAAVSRRIKSLEDLLGCVLFVRNKAGAVLTPAGRRFQVHAATLLRDWERARQEVGVIAPYRGSLTIGARFGLWDGYLLRSLSVIQERAPDIVLRAEVGFEQGLMQQLVDGGMDIGVMYTPQQRPGLCVEQLLQEELVLVRSATSGNELENIGYVHVDWGPEFNAQLNLRLPQLRQPALVASIGWLGLQHIISNGGSGYFPERLIRHRVAAGELVRIQDVPTFTLPAYVVYPEERDREVFDPAIQAMHEIATTA